MYRALILLILIGIFSCNSQSQNMNSKEGINKTAAFEVQKPEEEWKKELGEEAYYVLREKGTEYAFKGKYNDFKKDGIYLCNACGNELFTSDTKYDSGSGWPSFYAPFSEKSIKEIEDNSFGMKRIEVVCSKCGGHLGHVFPDGPKPTGMRYCVNSISLEFSEKEK